VREIDWIEAADNYGRIWSGGRSHLLRESMNQLEDRLRDHGFIRVHRRAIVPIAGVRELKWTGAGEMVVVLGSGVRIEVSRRRRATVAAAVRSPR
jgi:two-component system LytT family response regulator